MDVSTTCVEVIFRVNYLSLLTINSEDDFGLSKRQMINHFKEECTKLICFYVLFNVLAQMFLLVSCSYAFESSVCFVQGKGQRTKEIENKNLKKDWSRFITSSFYSL